MPNELIPQLEEIKFISERLAEVVLQAGANLTANQLASQLIQVCLENDKEDKGLSHALQIIFDLAQNSAKLDDEINAYYTDTQPSDILKLNAWNRYNLYYMGFDLHQKLAFCFYYVNPSYENGKSAIDALYQSLQYSEKAVKILDDGSENITGFLDPTLDRKELFEGSLLVVLRQFNTIVSECLFDRLYDFKQALTSQQRSCNENQLEIIEAILKNTSLALTMIQSSAYGYLNNLSPEYQEMYCEIAGMRADALRARGLFYAQCEARQEGALDDLLDAHALYEKIEKITLKRRASCRNEEIRGEMSDLIKNIEENKKICTTHTDRLQQNSGDLDTVERVLTVLSRSDRRGKRVLPTPSSNKEESALKRQNIGRSDKSNMFSVAQGLVERFVQHPSSQSAHTYTHVQTLFNSTPNVGSSYQHAQASNRAISLFGNK